MPHDAEQWGWRCGFLPASERGACAEGTATDFDQARSAFEAAWNRVLPLCTATDFAKYRRQRAWNSWKQTMWDKGCKLPTQTPAGRAQCFCGAAIEIRTMATHVYTEHMSETAAA